MSTALRLGSLGYSVSFELVEGRKCHAHFYIFLRACCPTVTEWRIELKDKQWQKGWHRYGGWDQWVAGQKARLSQSGLTCLTAWARGLPEMNSIFRNKIAS